MPDEVLDNHYSGPGNDATSTSAGFPAQGSASEKSFRIKQAFIVMLGSFVTHFLGAVILAVGIGIVAGFEFGIAHRGATKGHKAVVFDPPPFHLSGFSLLWLTIWSSLFAALWTVWYVRRRSGCRTTADLLAYVGYRPAGSRFYAYALGIALLCASFSWILIYFIPPHHAGSDIGKALAVTGTRGLCLFAALSLAAAPLLEEFIFRGIAFKALQQAMRPGYAAAIVTIVFVLEHAPEKVHYLPGFLSVGAFAVGAIWLRIKSNSVWPSTLLHVLSNAGVIIAAVIMNIDKHMV